MNDNGKSVPDQTSAPIGPSYGSTLGSFYGSTVFGGGNVPNDTILQSLRSGAIPQPPSVAGTHATEVKPHEQIAQLVSGFINGLIEHVVRRVVTELEPKLVDRWVMTAVEYRLRKQREEETVEHKQAIEQSSFMATENPDEAPPEE